MSDRATCWSLTINNPTPADEEGIALARQKGWSVEGQLEKGSEGTLHYQLMVKTPQVRFSAVKRAFPRAHIEIARNQKALQQYVTKEDTRQQALPTSQDLYPSLSKFWDLILKMFNEFNWLDIECYPERLWTKETADRSILTLFDVAVYFLIMRGYHVESLAVNPATRAQFKNYWGALFHRSWENSRRQTDRQTDSRSESEVSIPVIEYNNADDDSRTEGGLQSPCGDEASDSEDHEESPSASDEGYTESTDSATREEDDF